MQETSDGLEIAHVLFMDIVSYSLRPMDEQREIIAKLQDIVWKTSHFKAAAKTDQVIALPTGDGMALAFFGDPERAADCAVEIARVFKNEPQLKVRMGLHSGPVYKVADVNKNQNVAGGGINTAQRIMDAGDAGHILVSAEMAGTLCQLSRWKPYLFDFGMHEVKHGIRLHFYNLCTPDVGVSALPSKWNKEPNPRRSWRWPAILAALVLAALAGWKIWTPAPPPIRTHQLSYSLTVQKYKGGQPFQAPAQFAGETLFAADNGIAIDFVSQDAGYLYLINDGPLPDGAPSINILRPAPNASAFVGPGEKLRYPAVQFLRFDQATGTEMLYLVWARTPPAQLEQWKNLNSAELHGHVVIRDPPTIDQVRTFLAGNVIPKANVFRDENEKRTVLHSDRDVFAYLIRLEHH